MEKKRFASGIDRFCDMSGAFASYLILGSILLTLVAAQARADEPYQFPTVSYYSYKLKCVQENRTYMNSVVRQYEANNQDSLALIVKEWEESAEKESCSHDALTDYQLLTMMDFGQFNDYWKRYHLMRNLHYNAVYHKRAKRLSMYEFVEKYPWVELVPGSAFDSLLISIAEVRLADSTLSVEQRWICNFFARKPEGQFREIHGEQFRGTTLRNAYDIYGHELEESYEYHLSLGYSSWHPIGKLSTVGSHPSISAGLGVIGNGYLLRFDYTIRLGSSANPYTVLDNNALRTTTSFRMYSGLFSIGKRIWKQRRGGLFGLLGVGSDRLAFRSGDENSISSFNASLGVWYQLFLGKYSGRFLGISATYGVVGFDSGGGTDLSGNTITFGLRFGTTRATYTPNRHESLKQIQFYE